MWLASCLMRTQMSLTSQLYGVVVVIVDFLVQHARLTCFNDMIILQCVRQKFSGSCAKVTNMTTGQITCIRECLKTNKDALMLTLWPNVHQWDLFLKIDNVGSKWNPINDLISSQLRTG